jgi:hypothetical protein
MAKREKFQYWDKKTSIPSETGIYLIPAVVVVALYRKKLLLPYGNNRGTTSIKQNRVDYLARNMRVKSMQSLTFSLEKLQKNGNKAWVIREGHHRTMGLEQAEELGTLNGQGTELVIVRVVSSEEALQIYVDSNDVFPHTSSQTVSNRDLPFGNMCGDLLDAALKKYPQFGEYVEFLRSPRVVNKTGMVMSALALEPFCENYYLKIFKQRGKVLRYGRQLPDVFDMKIPPEAKKRFLEVLGEYFDFRQRMEKKRDQSHAVSHFLSAAWFGFFIGDRLSTKQQLTSKIGSLINQCCRNSVAVFLPIRNLSRDSEDKVKENMDDIYKKLRQPKR